MIVIVSSAEYTRYMQYALADTVLVHHEMPW